MKIGIYNISSPLHDNTLLNSKTILFLREIEERISLKFTNVFDDNDFYDLLLFYIQTGGTENLFKDKYFNKQNFFYLLTNGENNSLAASMEILSFLKKNGKNGEIIHGSMDYICAKVKSILNINNCLMMLKNTNLGVIGSPSDWLISSNVNYEQIKSKTNINLIDIGFNELLSEINKNKYNILDISQILSNDCFSQYDQTELEKSLYIYGALKRIISKYNLNGLTLRCFDLLDTTKSTGCLALALLNTEGITATCEGDIPSLISMYFAQILINKPSFQANPAQIDVSSKEIIFAHCTVPFSMLYSFSLDTHFESKLGLAIKGDLPKSIVTVFKFSNDLSRCYVENGTITENTYYTNLCRTQIKVKFENDITYFLTNPIANHHMIILGNYKKEIENFFALIKENTNEKF